MSITRIKSLNDYDARLLIYSCLPDIAKTKFTEFSDIDFIARIKNMGALVAFATSFCARLPEHLVIQMIAFGHENGSAISRITRTTCSLTLSLGSSDRRTNNKTATGAKTLLLPAISCFTGILRKWGAPVHCFFPCIFSYNR